MQKTLIALAVLAASGAAMAQSSVTLYGRVDAALAGTKTTETVNGVLAPTKAGARANGVRQTGIENGGAAGLTGSRWGMKGTEDLGGGLKANFVLENRFNVDDGNLSSGATMFQGSSYVSLSGGFGEVKLGRTYTAFDDARGLANTNNLWDSAFTPTGGVYAIGNVVAVPATGVLAVSGDYAGRGANQVRYESPSFGGVKANVSYAFGEDKTADRDASSIASLSILYAAGPLAVAYGYQKEEAVNGAGVLVDNKYHALSGAYNFGVAAVSAGANQRKSDAAGKDTEYTVGVNVPMNAFQFSVGYAHAKNELGAAESTGKGWGLGARYALSKRTSLYTGLKSVKLTSDAIATEVKTTLVSAGVRHDF